MSLLYGPNAINLVAMLAATQGKESTKDLQKSAQSNYSSRGYVGHFGGLSGMDSQPAQR